MLDFTLCFTGQDEESRETFLEMEKKVTWKKERAQTWGSIFRSLRANVA